MKTTFTPGPWRSKQEYANRWRIEQDTPNGATPFSVAFVTTTVLEVGSDNDTAPANARLISAAPDLLAALIGLDDAFCSLNNNMTREERYEARLKLIAARAAVAKAKGEVPA